MCSLLKPRCFLSLNATGMNKSKKPDDDFLSQPYSCITVCTTVMCTTMNCVQWWCVHTWIVHRPPVQNMECSQKGEKKKKLQKTQYDKTNHTSPWNGLHSSKYRFWFHVSLQSAIPYFSSSFYLFSYTKICVYSIYKTLYKQNIVSMKHKWTFNISLTKWEVLDITTNHITTQMS